MDRKPTPRRGRTARQRNGPSRIPASTRPATAEELKTLLRDHADKIYQALDVDPARAQISVPVDGKGLRLRAAVRGRPANRLPREIVLSVANEQVAVAVEASDDFQEFNPLGE